MLYLPNTQLNFISFKFIIQNFQEQGDYHNNRNSSQNYNVILTKIKMKSMEQKIDFIIIYYSNNWQHIQIHVSKKVKN